MTGRLVWAFFACVGTAGCGRFAFDDKAEVDAAVAVLDDAGQPIPLHRYRFDQNLKDDYSTTAIECDGGLIDSQGYHFDINQGLAVRGDLPVEVYTIDLYIALDRFDGHDDYVKLIDFRDRGADEGLYLHQGQLEFVHQSSSKTVSRAAAPYTFVTGELAEITMTRDLTGHMSFYVNRTFELMARDAPVVAEPTEGVLRFAEDDTKFVGEAQSGRIRQITIWNTVLTEPQIGALPALP